MKSKAIALALALAGLGLSGVVQAQASYSAYMQLEGLSALRPLSEFTLNAQPAPALGQWYNTFSGQYVTAYTPLGKSWDEGQHYSAYADAEVTTTGLIQPSHPMYNLSGAVQNGDVLATATGGGLGPVVTAQLPGTGGRAESQSNWMGYFALNARSSVTFDVAMSMSASGAGSIPIGQAVSSQNYDASGRFLELAFSGAAGQLRNSLQMGIYDPTFSGDYNSLLSYRMNDANHVAVTFTNDSDQSWNGWLQASSSLSAIAFSGVASPVPEPGMFAGLLTGLAVMGGMAWRRRQAGR